MAVGIQIDAGLALPDTQFINGIASGLNGSSQVLTAFAGGGQAGAKGLSPNALLVEIGTVASVGDSVALPFAVKGTFAIVFNASANSANIFGRVPVNKLTGVIDVINGVAGSTAYAIAGGVSVLFFCPANGVWAALKSA